MKHILLIGAGRSVLSLVEYLKKNSEKYDWTVTVGDYSLALAEERVIGFDKAEAIFFDVNNPAQLHEEVLKSDVVISMLPASMHLPVAEKCVELGKHLLTASYVSPEIRKLHDRARVRDILILMEMKNQNK